MDPEIGRVRTESRGAVPTPDQPRTLQAGTSETIRSAVRTLRDGGIMAVPTDTVFGIVGLFDSEVAIGRIYKLKGRPQSKPLPLLLGTAADLPLVTPTVPQSIWPLIGAFWPGPLTLVLPAHRMVSSLITARTGTVGVRVPAHPAVLDVLEAVNLPLVSTSANLSGKTPAGTAMDVVSELGNAVDLVIDSPSPGSGVASTVLDLTVSPPLIRRKGSILPGQIREVLGGRVDVMPNA